MADTGRILVTGAGGYIGSITSDYFLAAGKKLVGVDNFSTGFEAPLQKLQEKFGPENFAYFNRDISGDLSDIFSKYDISTVVHFAGSISVSESVKNPQKYFSNNVCASQSLFSQMLAKNVKQVVFSSTCAVYGKAKYVPVDEAHQTQPINPYGESKNMIEKMLQWYSACLGLRFVALRYFNVCGASDNSEFGYSQQPSNHLVQNAVKGALGLQPFFITCAKVDTPDKTPIRDYINVVDLADAHLKAVDYLQKGGKNQIINLGTGIGDSVLEILQKVQLVLGVKFDIQTSLPREGEYAKMIASIEKAKQILDWSPSRSLEDSITSLTTWFKAHPRGWSKE